MFFHSSGRFSSLFLFSGKSFPKITITTENSPSHASVIEEDLSSSHEFERIDTELESDPMGIPPVISATLTRSKTDSNIAYPLLEYQEARGASNLIHDEGELNYQALIRAVLVALNERPSQRICDVALSLLDVLLDVLSDTKPGGGNISNTDDHEALIRIHSHTSPTTPTQSTGPLTVVFHDVVTHRLFMSCITRYACGSVCTKLRTFRRCSSSYGQYAILTKIHGLLRKD